MGARPQITEMGGVPGLAGVPHMWGPDGVSQLERVKRRIPQFPDIWLYESGGWAMEWSDGIFSR